MINFVDVTWACEQPDALYDDGTKCKYAEVFIHADVGEIGGDLAAYVINSLSGEELILDPTTTAGVHLEEGFGLTRSEMKVSTDICWYLDNTFCYNFHRWNEDGIDVVLMIRLIFAGVYVVAGLTMLWILGNLVSAFCCPTQTMLQRGESDLESENKKFLCGGPRCDSILRYAAEMSVGGLLFSLFWLIFMPIFYWRVFLPCWDCYDFQATIAHEFGHVLGYDHPDTLPYLNLRAMSGDDDEPVPMNNATCHDALMHVELEPLPEGADTIMISVTKHRDRSCLTRDDVEGLNFLYPQCAGALTDPVCEESKRQSGWLRLAIAVGFPFIFATVLVVCIQTCVRIHQKRQLKKLERAVHMLRHDRAALRRSLQSMPSRSRAQLTRGGSRFISGLGGALDDLMHGRLPTPRGGPGREPSIEEEQVAEAMRRSLSDASGGAAPVQPVQVEVSQLSKGAPRASGVPPAYHDAVDGRSDASGDVGRTHI